MTARGPSLLPIARRTVRAWIDDDAIRWSAAIAYYSVLSLAPLVVLAITILGRIVDSRSAEQWVLRRVAALGGAQARNVASTILSDVPVVDPTSAGAMLTVLLLLFGATAVFVTLQRALNHVWEVAPRDHALGALLRTRLTAFAIVLALGGVVVLTVFLGAAVRWLANLIPALGVILPWLTVGDVLSSLFLLWLGVGTVFWQLPDVEITWRDVGFGALVTAVLLVTGKAGLSVYVGLKASSSMYGAAGSVFLLLLWIYYSALVFFLGAEFTRVWADERGREIRPSPHALWSRVVESDEVERTS